jgi:lysophospholipase L1-like esterase
VGGYGDRLEDATRNWLSTLPGFDRRAVLKDSLVQLLYRARLYLLHLKPSTARSITGARLSSSRASVEQLARYCHEQGINLVMFNAPVNPRVHLYRSETDSRYYHEFIQQVAARYHVRLYDFESIVPAENWGKLLDGPDPLHMGRIGHQIVAAKMIDALSKELHSRGQAEVR